MYNGRVKKSTATITLHKQVYWRIGKIPLYHIMPSRVKSNGMERRRGEDEPKGTGNSH